MSSYDHQGGNTEALKQSGYKRWVVRGIPSCREVSAATHAGLPGSPSTQRFLGPSPPGTADIAV